MRWSAVSCDQASAHIRRHEAERGYLERHPLPICVERGGARTVFAVPMLKDGALVGAFASTVRSSGRSPTSRSSWWTNFAAQAVIAIENTRLLNELRQRTDDLTESLEQQTATSRVLEIICISDRRQPVSRPSCGSGLEPFPEAPVRVRFGARSLNMAKIAAIAGAARLSRSGVRVIRCRPARIHDLQAPSRRAETDLADIPDRPPACLMPGRAVRARRRYRAITVMPLMRAKINWFDQGLSAASRPLHRQQIELLQNFAAQAVIAIENTRLLNELRQRTDDLTDSLQQQTASVRVPEPSISGSVDDTNPQFDAIVRNRQRLFGTHPRWCSSLKTGWSISRRCGGGRVRPDLLVLPEPARRIYRRRPHILSRELMHSLRSSGIRGSAAKSAVRRQIDRQ